jgi:hypothetical protein
MLWINQSGLELVKGTLIWKLFDNFLFPISLLKISQ